MNWHYCIDGKIKRYESLLCSSEPFGNGIDFDPVTELNTLRSQLQEAVGLLENPCEKVVDIGVRQADCGEVIAGIRVMCDSCINADAFLARIRAGSSETRGKS